MKMRHSTEPRFKKYVKGYGFLSFSLKFADKYGKKLMDTATKTGIDAAELHLKDQFKKLQKLRETWLEIKKLIKLLQQPNQKKKKKQKKQKKFTFQQTKDNKLLMTLDCFEPKM